MKDENVARFILRQKILDIIDDLKRDDKFGNDPSNVVEFAILQLHNEYRDDVEKAEEDSIDQYPAIERSANTKEEIQTVSSTSNRNVKLIFSSEL